LSGGLISNNNAASAGGGIYNQGSLILSGGLISNNNAASAGGGIYNNSSYFNINGGTISGNVAGEGAGLYNNAGAAGPITPRITSGSIDNNGSYCSYGGGIYNNTTAALSIYGGIISNNNVYYEGGGIYNKGTLEMFGGKLPEADATISFSGNTAEYGSGIYTSSQITLGGSFVIPESDNIYLYGGSINLSEELSNTGIFYVYAYDSREGMQILSGGSALIVGYRNLFMLADTRFKLDDEGYTYFDAAPVYYYVGGDNASDTNTGTNPASPFETLAAAIDAIGSARAG
jgi:predicted outer membrane repeat protein